MCWYVTCVHVGTWTWYTGVNYNNLSFNFVSKDNLKQTNNENELKQIKHRMSDPHQYHYLNY